ncbi:MAG: regulatory protein RecX [bacterium]|nr:regulatory protein RecX [bacterium]
MMPGSSASREPLGRVLNWLARRDRSEREIRERLRSWGVADETGESILKTLSRRGLVDDRALAENISDWHNRHDPVGPRRLREKLRARGIGESDAEPAIAPLRDWAIQLELAGRLLDKRLPALGNLSPERRWRRMTGFLERRGFDRGIVIELCRPLLREAESDREAFD